MKSQPAFLSNRKFQLNRSLRLRLKKISLTANALMNCHKAWEYHQPLCGAALCSCPPLMRLRSMQLVRTRFLRFENTSNEQIHRRNDDRAARKKTYAEEVASEAAIHRCGWFTAGSNQQAYGGTCFVCAKETWAKNEAWLCNDANGAQAQS